ASPPVLFLRDRARTPQDPALQRYSPSHFRLGRPATAGGVSRGWSVSVCDSGPRLEIRCRRNQLLKATGLKAKRTSVQAPCQNGIAERWVGSCRREILDHVI